MKTVLEGLKWKPAWVSQLGCIEGCLEYAGIPMTRAWLFGGTGHAFALNIAWKDACPSGPTAWRFCAHLYEAAPNLGFEVGHVTAMKWGSGFPEGQKEAWEFVRAALDRGIPCLGWELDIPEFYVLAGYDETGYYYTGCTAESLTGPKPWQSMGEAIGWLEAESISPTAPAPPEKTVKDALTFAVEQNRDGNPWVMEGYRSGPGAFEAWATALESGEYHAFGNGYNAQVWHECRRQAVAFLEEAQEKFPSLPASTVEAAKAAYTVVAERLHALTNLFPFPPQGEGTPAANLEGAALLRDAARSEAQALAAVEAVAAAI